MGEYVISKSIHVTDIKDFIELRGECGSGKFATVQKSRLKSSGIEVAVKIINKAKTYEHTKNGEHKNDPFYRVEREIKILSSLSHPHIVEYKGCYEDNDNVYILQDYVTYDNCKFDLDDYLLYHGNLSELHSHHLFCQLLSAIEYIHYKNICHCDLKTANILISNIGVKLIDFGLSRYFQKDLLFHKVYGTPNYMSPEIYLNTPEPGYDGVKADIWACGIILYIMITREKPFIGEDIMELRNNIINHQYTPITTVSDELNDLLSKMFIKDPNERISLSQIKHHIWITKNNTDSEEGKSCNNKTMTVSTPTSEKKNNHINNVAENNEIKNENDDLPLNRSSSITLALAKTTKQKKNHNHIIPPLYPNNPLFQSEPDINSGNNNNKTNSPFNGNAISIYEFIAEQNNEEEDDDDEEKEEKENEIENPKHKRHYSFQSFPISSLHSAKTTPSFKPRSMSTALSMSNTSPFLSSFSLLPPAAVNYSNSSSNNSIILPLPINSSTNSNNNSFSLLSSFPSPQNNTNGSNNNSTTPTGQYSLYPQQSPFLQPIPVLPHTYSLSLDDDYGEEEEECDLDAIWQFRG